MLGAALAVWAKASVTGLALRAAAEDERAAMFARLSPTFLGTTTWVLSTVFSSLVLILAGPAIGVLTAGGLTLLVVPALAVALIARLQSLWWALFGAFGLGALQAELVYLSSTRSWWPEWAKYGLKNAVPFIVIVITLFAIGRSIPVRGDTSRVGLPQVTLPRNRPVTIVVWTVAGLILIAATHGSYRFGVITSLASALIALSLVVLTGMVGQISLAQTAFAGLAGLVLAKIGTHVPFPLSLVIAVAVATVVGTLVGLPALRIRGAQLAVVTLAAAVAVEELVFNGPGLLANSGSIPSWRLFGIDLSVRAGRDLARWPYAVFVLLVVVVAFVVVGNVLRGTTGRRLLAVRSNERAAAAVGVDVRSVKLGAFALSSGLAGLGGALIATSRGQLSSASFGVFVGLGFLAVTYLSGIASMSGAVVAGGLVALGVVYVVLDRSLGVAAYYALISGPLLIITVIINPSGIAGRTRSLVRRLRRSDRGESPPGAVDDSAEAMVDAVRPWSRDAAPDLPRREREIGDVVLRLDEISVNFGGLRAVDRVTLELRAGQIVGLIGPNGAGKTSLLDAITGFTPSSGVVTLAGERLEARSAHRRVRAGLARTWQSIELFDDLTVLDNVRVGTERRRRFVHDVIHPEQPSEPAVVDALELVGLTAVADRHPNELPLGQQKLVGIARALALGPRALLLDEPAAGLDTLESATFADHLRRVAATGVACLLIDHDMHLVLGTCDEVHVIDFGRQIAEGTPADVRRSPAVRTAYLGSAQLDDITS